MKKIKNVASIARLERLRAATEKTWDQIAEDLGVNRSMIFHVLSDKRQFSPKLLRRLLESEIAAGIKTRSRALIEEGFQGQNLVAALLDTESANSEVASSDIERGFKEVSLRFRKSKPTGFPLALRVKAASNETVWKLGGQEGTRAEPSQFLSACLPDNSGRPEFLDLLTPECYIKLLETALDLTFGLHWRQNDSRTRLRPKKPGVRG